MPLSSLIAVFLPPPFPFFESSVLLYRTSSLNHQYSSTLSIRSRILQYCHLSCLQYYQTFDLHIFDTYGWDLILRNFLLLYGTLLPLWVTVGTTVGTSSGTLRRIQMLESYILLRLQALPASINTILGQRLLSLSHLHLLSSSTRPESLDMISTPPLIIIDR